MNNILILGALPKSEEDIKLYKTIVCVAKDFTETIRSPIETAKFHGTENERYERALSTVKEADLVIGEQSQPSTGQGIEIRECVILKKPLIVVAKEGSIVSGLVKGCPITKDIIYYRSFEDLKKKLKSSISKL